LGVSQTDEWARSLREGVHRSIDDTE
jgi:hypothetical protein